MDTVTRMWTAALLGGLGVAALLKPGAFFGVKNVFRLVLRQLAPSARERLERVLTARQESEGVSTVPARIMGAFSIATAALELMPSIDFVIPYALLCLSGGFAFLLRYLQITRATERRVAMLTRRSPYDSLTPALVGAIGTSFAGTAVFALLPAYRLVALLLLVYIAVLAWVAWRIASSPAIVQGDDPELEYAVDERLRRSRVAGVTALACAPSALLIGLSYRLAEPAMIPFATAAFTMVALGCAVTIFVNTMRKFSMRPLNGTA